jgi:hypothetical protein
MKYIVELLCGDFKSRWVRSYKYPLKYTYTEAHNIIWTPTALTYRLRPADEKVRALPVKMVKPVKPYRRHAAVTQLELRGAISMLQNAQDHVVRATQFRYSDFESAHHPRMILVDARLASERALEAL